MRTECFCLERDNKKVMVFDFKVYKSRASMLRAARRRAPIYSKYTPEAVFNWSLPKKGDHLDAILFFHEDYLNEQIVAHEIMHAVCTIYEHLFPSRNFITDEAHQEDACRLMQEITQTFWEWWREEEGDK